MKKVLSLVLVAMLSISVFAGCAKTDDTKKDDTKQDTKKEDVKKDEKKDDKKTGTITAKELLKNKNARLAIAMAYNKQDFCDTILNNGSVPTDNFVPADFVKSEDGADFVDRFKGQLPTYNVEEAKKLWAKAKEELGFDTVEVGLIADNGGTAKEILEYLQAQLQNNLEGLSVKLNMQPWKNKLALCAEGNYDIQLYGWSPDYPDAMTFLDLFITDGGLNEAGFSNKEYDEVVADAKNGELAAKPAERFSRLQDIEKILLDEGIAAPIYQQGLTYVQRTNFKGMERHYFGADYTFDTVEMDEADKDGKKILKYYDTQDIPTADSTLGKDQVSIMAMTNCMEGLFSLDANDGLEKELCEDMTVSEDKKTYTFKLRKDGKWSNGDPVTAHDFVYSWRRLADPNTKAPYSYVLPSTAIKNAVDVTTGKKDPSELGVKATDDYTLVVELDVPVAYFTKMLTFSIFYPLNQKFVEAQGDKFGTSIETTLYNGPFVLSSWNIGYEYAYAKNPTYRDQSRVKIDGVNFRIIKDVATRVNAYEAGEIDRIGLKGEFVEKYMDDEGFGTYNTPNVYNMVFNINKGKNKSE